MKKKRLLFLGDSLMEYFNWAGRFKDHDVHNLGIAGEPVEGLASRLDSIFRAVKDPDIVFIMSGINNIAIGEPGFLDNYRAMVQKIKSAYPEAVVVVHSLLPVLFRSISNEDIRSLNSGLQILASEEKVQYLDLHTLFLDENGGPKQSCLMNDGVHVSSEGYRIWSSALEKFLSFQ